MKHASITIPDELEKALEDYRRDLEITPVLAAMVRTALRESLKAGVMSSGGAGPPSGGKSSLFEDALKIGGKRTAADVMIEDRHRSSSTSTPVP